MRTADTPRDAEKPHLQSLTARLEVVDSPQLRPGWRPPEAATLHDPTPGRRPRSTFSASQVGSNSYQARPWRADVGWAWWLLCQPSPNVRSATHQLLRESSFVAKRRRPHMWVAELTSHVACSPTTTRRKIAQLTSAPAADGEEREAERPSAAPSDRSSTSGRTDPCPRSGA